MQGKPPVDWSNKTPGKAPVDWNHARNLYHEYKHTDFNDYDEDPDKLYDDPNHLIHNATDYSEWQDHEDIGQNHYLSHIAAGPWQDSFTTARGVRRSAWDLMGKAPNKTYTADPHIQHNNYEHAAPGIGEQDQVNQDNAHMAYALMHGIHNAPVDNTTHLYRMAKHPDADGFISKLRTGNTFNMPMASFASHEPDYGFGSDIKFHILPGHKTVKGSLMGETQDIDNPMEDIHEHIAGGKFKVAGVQRGGEDFFGNKEPHTVHLQHVGTIDPDPLVDKKMSQTQQMVAAHDPNEIDISQWDELFDGPSSEAHKKQILQKKNERAKAKLPKKNSATYDNSDGSLTFKYTKPKPQYAYEGASPSFTNHRIDAYRNGEHAGYMELNPGTQTFGTETVHSSVPKGLIDMVDIKPKHEGVGIARALGEHAESLGVTPIHSDILSHDGTGFAAATPQWGRWDSWNQKVIPGVKPKQPDSAQQMSLFGNKIPYVRSSTTISETVSKTGAGMNPKFVRTTPTGNQLSAVPGNGIPDTKTEIVSPFLNKDEEHSGDPEDTGYRARAEWAGFHPMQDEKLPQNWDGKHLS